MELSDIFGDEKKLIEASRKGLTKREYGIIAQKTGLTINGFASYTHMTSRTLQRKKYNEKISVEASERAILIGKLYYKGEQLFGDLERFKKWMDSNNISLDGKKPKDYLDTFAGINLINEELLRIEYGYTA